MEKVVIIGSKKFTEDMNEEKFHSIISVLSEILHSSKITAITGAGSGIPLEVAKRLKEKGDKTIAISPFFKKEEIKKGWPQKDDFSQYEYYGTYYERLFKNDFKSKPSMLNYLLKHFWPFFMAILELTPYPVRLKIRNVFLMVMADFVISISGGKGTMAEFAIALTFEKPIIVLEFTGGFSGIARQICKAIGHTKNVHFAKNLEQVKQIIEQLTHHNNI